MKWVTREKVKVDRVACPWLIDKFIDPEAEFIFVPVERVMEVAATQNAVPYDVKFVEFGHQGKECSFEAIAAEKIVYDALYAYCQRAVAQGKPDGMFR